MFDSTPFVGQKNMFYRQDGKPTNNHGNAGYYYNYSQDYWGVNPLFVNAAAGNFHLQSRSPGCLCLPLWDNNCYSLSH